MCCFNTKVMLVMCVLIGLGLAGLAYFLVSWWAREMQHLRDIEDEWKIGG